MIMKKKSLSVSPKYHFFALLALLLLATGCKKNADLSEFEKPLTPKYTNDDEWYALTEARLNIGLQPLNYELVLPNKLKAKGPKVNNNLAELGRVLFYDKNLSKDGKVSCASCHEQSLAFADNKAFSTGILERSTDRNSFALLGRVATFNNAGVTDIYTKTQTIGSSAGAGPSFLFWDERASGLTTQTKATFANPREMGMQMDEVVSAVEAQLYYPWLFKRAFGSHFVTEDKVLDAIAEFVSAISSTNSKLDQELANLTTAQTFSTFRGVELKGFSAAESLGKRLYDANCESCHASLNSLPFISAAYNGITLAATDLGKGAITFRSGDEGVFKVPLLRNVALTAPYMHDGRFKNLEEVIDHYSAGIQEHKNLHPLLREEMRGKPKRMNFSETEKQALIAFLNTMTDEYLLRDERYSDPFKK
jgi:cytochrome c peroxidase